MSFNNVYLLLLFIDFQFVKICINYLIILLNYHINGNNYIFVNLFTILVSHLKPIYGTSYTKRNCISVQNNTNSKHRLD